MAVKRDKRDLAKFLQCSSILEEKVAAAYESFAERAQNPSIKPLLLFISYDSLKHSRILKMLGELIAETTVTTDECETMLGKAWMKSIFQAQKEAMKKETTEDNELASLIDEMINFESFLGEEYLTILHLKTMQLIAMDPRIDQPNLKRILVWIVEDEERHELILTRIRALTTTPKEE